MVSWAVYDDGRSGIRQEYDPKQKEVYQSLRPSLTEKQIRSIQTIFSGLFRGSEKLGPDFAGSPDCQARAATRFRPWAGMDRVHVVA